MGIAKDNLNAFLEKPGEQGAMGLKAELDRLGDFLIFGRPGAKWIPGPIKKIEKAMSKTSVDYDYSWGLNKDLVRATVACKSKDEVTAVVSDIRQTCTLEFGMFLVKGDEQKCDRGERLGGRKDPALSRAAHRGR